MQQVIWCIQIKIYMWQLTFGSVNVLSLYAFLCSVSLGSVLAAKSHQFGKPGESLGIPYSLHDAAHENLNRANALITLLYIPASSHVRM